MSKQRRDGRRVVFANGKIAYTTGAAPVAEWTFPAPLGKQAVIAEFTMADTVTMSRHLKVPEIRSYMTATAVRDLTDPNPQAPVASDDSGLSPQTFMVEVLARCGSEERRAIARGRDIYGFTAPLVVEAMARVLGGQVKTTGVLTAGEAFDARDFLASLCPTHLLSRCARPSSEQGKPARFPKAASRMRPLPFSRVRATAARISLGNLCDFLSARQVAYLSDLTENTPSTGGLRTPFTSAYRTIRHALRPVSRHPTHACGLR